MPLSGRADDLLEGLGAAFSGLQVRSPKKEKQKEAFDMGAEEVDPGGEHDPSDEVPFDDKPSESAPSASEHRAAPSPHIKQKSSPTTTPPMAEGLGFAGMPYPTYGVDPVATAPPMATAVCEPVASSSTYTDNREPMPRL